MQMEKTVEWSKKISLADRKYNRTKKTCRSHIKTWYIFVYTVEFAYISTSGGLQKSADIRELPM